MIGLKLDYSNGFSIEIPQMVFIIDRDLSLVGQTAEEDTCVYQEVILNSGAIAEKFPKSITRSYSSF